METSDLSDSDEDTDGAVWTLNIEDELSAHSVSNTVHYNACLWTGSNISTGQ